ncbi:S-methyl-5'-thioadenosine phosphorylase, partial [Phascolarctobacterium faecium]|uniref:phosphorylase family protein n=1 Tax=Phascolarctobacterium faecium TaxID=33025 RepID=UPI003848DE69|nr:S-methyl-5'-thioadenosine phosphorylase [Phascolarctobacterium faecium]
VAHVDFTNPFCPRLRDKGINCLYKTDIIIHKKGCYVCTEGPRFETAAAIKLFAMFGGDLVGMTNMPESL